MSVDEEIRGRAVDQLKTARAHRFPVIRGHALADDASGDRDELIVDVLNAESVDECPALLDQIASPWSADIRLQLGCRADVRHSSSSRR